MPKKKIKVVYEKVAGRYQATIGKGAGIMVFTNPSLPALEGQVRRTLEFLSDHTGNDYVADVETHESMATPLEKAKAKELLQAELKTKTHRLAQRASQAAKEVKGPGSKQLASIAKDIEAIADKL